MNVDAVVERTSSAPLLRIVRSSSTVRVDGEETVTRSCKWGPEDPKISWSCRDLLLQYRNINSLARLAASS